MAAQGFFLVVTRGTAAHLFQNAFSPIGSNISVKFCKTVDRTAFDLKHDAQQIFPLFIFKLCTFSFT